MTYRIKPRVLLQAVADEMVLLDPESGVYFTLDPVGRRMLELYREHDGSRERTISALLEEYDADAQTLGDDLDALLQSMVAEGLAEPITSHA